MSILAPLSASAAQLPEASPVVDPTATQSPEATTEPTITPEPSPTNEPEFNAIATDIVGGAASPLIEITLSDETPNLGDTVTVTVILTNPTTEPVTVDTSSVQLPAGVAYVTNSGNVVCLPLNCRSASVTEESGVVLGYAEHPLLSSGPTTTTVTFDVTINLDAELGVPLTLSAPGTVSGIVASPDSVSLTVQAPVPSLGATLSDVAPNLGDIVTVTAILANPSTELAETATITVGLPTGVALLAGSSTMTCGGAPCGSAPTQELPQIVSGVANFVAGPGPTTATLTFDVIVDATAPTGQPLTFTVDGESGGAPIPGDHSINLTVRAPQPLIVIALNGTLDVPFESEGQGVLTAIYGLQPYVFSLETQAIKGIATIEPDGNFVYIASPGQTGTDQFTFLVSTANSTDTAVIRITIREPGALVAESLAVDIDFNGSATGTLADQVTGGIPPYTFGLDTTPTRGQVTITPDGSFTYTANLGESGQDTFTYTVTDSQAAPTAAATVTGQVNLIIAAPDSTPTVEPSATTEPTESTEPTFTAPATTQPSATATAITTDPVATATTGVSQLPSTGSGTSGPSSTTPGLLALALICFAAASRRLLRKSFLSS